MICELISVCALLLGAVSSQFSPDPSSPSTFISDEGPCRIYNFGLSADCQGRQLDFVPWRQLPVTLESIDLSYNGLHVVSAADFQNFPQLRILLLQFNNITHIANEAFKNNPLLEHLNIFNNSLHEIPASPLTSLLNLKELFMSNNLYRHATLADSFSKLVRLKVLSLGGPLVMGLKKNDFQPLKNIQLQTFAIKCSSNLSYYEPGSLEVIHTKQMGFDMAIDQRPNALHHMLRDLANKTLSVIQFRNLFEFTYYMGDEDIFLNLKDIIASQLIFHRGKFNENLLKMALLNLQVTPIKWLRLQYIDFARSPTFVDSGAGSSITELSLDNLDLWYISNPDVLRFDWRFTWFKRIKQLSIHHSDADWVRDQLLPCLENNKNPYRLCIHERDFMPGKWIIDNIIENIESSRKVIFVLSRHFVNSEWCNYELYFAQQRAMGKTFSDVILVVKEPIDPSSLPSKYCKLKKMLSTKTYLEWPQQVNQQPFFWAQLRSVLGKPTMTREGTNSIRSRNTSERFSVVEERIPEVNKPLEGNKKEIQSEIIHRTEIELQDQRNLEAQ
ncbi:toll-like receptor 18 isoform X2 [Poecilia formosa]|uniref:toll-like receptor 18 isoform X2 n=1 Tax=Poecilia formosa TaxID=48698 RepID=UPI0007BA5913|nr:PREDICTED: toll-like receptor 1 isoform X2 [Poecilia formosa]